MQDNIPIEAKRYYDEAVAILQEDIAQRRTIRTTDAVIGNLKRATEEYSRYLDAWRLLGEFYLGTEQTLLGYLALKRAHTIDDNDSGTLTLLGEASMILNRSTLALEYLEKANASEKPPLAARKMLALALAKIENWQDALRAFGENLGEDPSDGNMRREASNALSMLGFKKEAASILADFLDPYRDFIDTEPAISETDWIMSPGSVLDRLAPGAKKAASGKEINAHPDDYTSWYLLGNLFLDAELYEAASACYRRSLRAHPDYYDALLNMGIALEELGRHEEALRMYEEAIETDPETADAYLNVAELLEEISPDETDEIALNFLMYYHFDPDAEGFEELESEITDRLGENPDISQILLLVDIYISKDEIQKAEKLIRRLEETGIEEASVLCLKGKVMRALGRTREAELAFLRGLELVSDDSGGEAESDDDTESKLRFDLALMLSEDNRKDEAMGILEKGREILNADGLSLLAELQAEIPGKEDAANANWNLALELDETHPDALIGLADKLIEKKQIEEGIILLERAFINDPEDGETIEKLRQLYPQIGAPELAP